MIPEPAKQVINSNALAHMVTLNRDGSPHVTCAWAGLDSDEIVIATMSDQKKLRNLRHDPRVSLSFETGKMNDWGLTEYLVIHGRARVTEGGAPELLQELAYTYIGPDVKFPAVDNPPAGFITRITVDRVGGVGRWASS